MQFIDLILHLDKYIGIVVSNYHNYYYLILFLVIFAETGLVITPFLPGDSLLFMSGSIAALGSLDIKILAVIIVVAACCGDNSNYLIGRFIGTKLFSNPQSKIFRQSLLIKTTAFYQNKGNQAVIIARFIPIIRTFTPFVAGVATMSYNRFIFFSIIGSVSWVLVFLCGGYAFGNLPVIRNNLSIIILLILIITIIPVIKMVWDEVKPSKK
ncbi:MAG: DedA family protein [Burkholderiales bacterium]|nr:DedA family protein [Burkholderiales bacterium]